MSQLSKKNPHGGLWAVEAGLYNETRTRAPLEQTSSSPSQRHRIPFLTQIPKQAKGPCQNGESTILARPFFFFKLYCGKLALSVSFFAHCPRGVLLLWFSFAYLIVYSARDRREMRLELSTPGPTAHFAVYGGASRSCMPGSVKSTQLPLYTSLVA